MCVLNIEPFFLPVEVGDHHPVLFTLYGLAYFLRGRGTEVDEIGKETTERIAKYQTDYIKSI